MFWRGCLSLIVLFVVFFGGLYGIYLWITPSGSNANDYTEVALINEDTYYECLNFSSSTLDEFNQLKGKNYPIQQGFSSDLSEMLDNLSAKEVLVFLAQNYLDNTLESEYLNSDALIGLNRDHCARIVSVVSRSDNNGDYALLISFFISDSWARTTGDDTELIQMVIRLLNDGYLEDNHFGIAMTGVQPQTIENVLQQLSLINKDGSIMVETLLQKPFEWIAKSLDSFEKDTIQYGKQYKTLLSSLMSLRNDNLNVNLISYLSNNLSSEISEWKLKNLEEVIEEVNDDEITAFLEQSHYVNPEWGGLFLTYNPEVLFLFTNEIRTKISQTLDQGFVTFFEAQIIDDMALEFELIENEGTLAFYSQLIEEYPGESINYLERGKILVSDYKDFKSAIEDFNMAISLDETLSDAYFQRSLASEGLNDLTSSIADYDTVLFYDTGNKYALGNRAILKHELSNYAGAVQDFSETLSIDSGYIDAWYGRALSKSFLGDTSGSLSDYESALLLDDHYSNAYINRALINLSLGENNKALADYLIPLSYEDKNLDALYGIGYTYFQLDSLNQSKEYYTRLTEIDPDQTGSFYSLGLVYNRLEDYQKAYSYLTKTIFMDSAYTDAYFERGVVSINRGDTLSACLDWVKARELGNDEANQYLTEHCKLN
ncbi:MAG: hypothetical protein O2887_16985 [Bacteroidetes bacterium]|nr:hypothetical protein [Bacteroidota bacterium]MDA1122156.1 hypothetical protein [Bacteroidota bacterium]